MTSRLAVRSWVATVCAVLPVTAQGADDCEALARRAAERAAPIAPPSLLDARLGDPALDLDGDRFEAERAREVEYRRMLEQCLKRKAEEERLEAEIP